MSAQPVYCSRHPKVETALACARCATPICPNCLVSGPVGMLCKACASQGKSPLFVVRPERAVLAVVCGIVSGAVAGMLLRQLGFYTFFISPVIGGFLGKLVLWATGHKRGIRVEWLTGGSIVVGAMLAAWLTGVFRGWGTGFGIVSPVLFFVSVGLVVAAAVAKIRYY